MRMRGTIIIAAAFSAAALLAMGAIAQDVETETPTVPQEAQWPEFRSPERGFEIAFPATPKETSSTVAGQNPLMRYNFEAYEGDDTVYRLVVLEYPAGKAPNQSISGRLYNVAGIPTVFIIDMEGKVAESVVGYSEGDTRVDQALAKLGVNVK